jgi:hypothetical protein
MLAPQALIRGIVQRLLPTVFYDDRDTDRSARFSRYGEFYTQPVVRKQHGLADEGSYFITHNAQTGVVSSLISTAFAETTLSPYLIITNTDSGDRGKSIYLDYLNLICTVVGGAGSGLTTLLYAWSVDQSATRWASGGTDLTGVPASGGGTYCPNTNVSKRSSVAQVNIGALTLNAATSNRKIVVPQRQLRQQNSGTVMGVVGDSFHMNFGGVEQQSVDADIGTATTVARKNCHVLPPIVIAPQHCAILHIWSPGGALTTGITLLPELAAWER